MDGISGAAGMLQQYTIMLSTPKEEEEEEGSGHATGEGVADGGGGNRSALVVTSHSGRNGDGYHRDRGT